MTNEPVCEKCGGLVSVVPTIGDSTLDEWYCQSAECEAVGRVQGPCVRGRYYHEHRIFDDGSIEMFQRGRESQNEENCSAVADAITSHFGVCCVCRSPDEPEMGHDANLLIEDRIRRVQITRAINEKFCAKVGAQLEATLSVSPQDYVNLIERAIQRKDSSRDPDAVLAIDVGFPADFSIWLYSQLRPSVWERLRSIARHAGWYDVLVVGRNRSLSLRGTLIGETGVDL